MLGVYLLGAFFSVARHSAPLFSILWRTPQSPCKQDICHITSGEVSSHSEPLLPIAPRRVNTSF